MRLIDADAVVRQLEAAVNKIEMQYEYNYEKGLSDGLVRAIEIVEGGVCDGK